MVQWEDFTITINTKDGPLPEYAHPRSRDPKFSTDAAGVTQTHVYIETPPWPEKSQVFTIQVEKTGRKYEQKVKNGHSFEVEVDGNASRRWCRMRVNQPVGDKASVDQWMEYPKSRPMMFTQPTWNTEIHEAKVAKCQTSLGCIHVSISELPIKEKRIIKQSRSAKAPSPSSAEAYRPMVLDESIIPSSEPISTHYEYKPGGSTSFMLHHIVFYYRTKESLYKLGIHRSKETSIPPAAPTVQPSIATKERTHPIQTTSTPRKENPIAIDITPSINTRNEAAETPTTQALIESLVQKEVQRALKAYKGAPELLPTPQMEGEKRYTNASTQTQKEAILQETNTVDTKEQRTTVKEGDQGGNGVMDSKPERASCSVNKASGSSRAAVTVKKEAVIKSERVEVKREKGNQGVVVKKELRGTGLQKQRAGGFGRLVKREREGNGDGIDLKQEGYTKEDNRGSKAKRPRLYEAVVDLTDD